MGKKRAKFFEKREVEGKKELAQQRKLSRQCKWSKIDQHERQETVKEYLEQ